MLMADTFAIALSIIGFLLSLQGLWLLSRALWPQRFAACVSRSRRNPVASFLVGLPIAGAVGLIAAVATTTMGAFGQVLGISIWFLYLIYANVGVAGFVTHLGQRLASPTDEARPWAATVRGGVAFELASLVPLLGWFLILPAGLVLGGGAMTLSFFRSKKDLPQSILTMPPTLPSGEHAFGESTPVYRVPEPAEVMR